jgi:hypothetical protein
VKYEREIDDLSSRRLISAGPESIIRLTRKGMDFANQAFMMFI